MMTVDDIAKLARLVSAERLDALEVLPDGGVRITKTMHAPMQAAASSSASDDDEEDDLLFHSSGA